jgi:DNA-directed RNA polymerase subunit M/transcription elongation factor TFIIS
MERFCLECNTLLIGRADKKFCDDQCRSNYNHRLKVDEHSFVNSVNQILKKNRRILKTQNPSSKIKIKRDTLLSNGFDFNLHTSTYTTKKGNVYFFCYEYGYMHLENEEILLVKREER